MGQINVTFWGSMSPLPDGGARRIDINHVGSFKQTVDEARAAIDQYERDMRAIHGDEGYEAPPSWASAATAAPAFTTQDLAKG